MSASYTRVNWADYPATTTPVNAENLNKMDAGIAGLTSEINSVESDVSALNSSLTDNYGGTNNKFRFATDGAGNFGYLKADDSFAPFSSKEFGYLYTLAGGRTSVPVSSATYGTGRFLMILCGSSGALPDVDQSKISGGATFVKTVMKTSASIGWNAYVIDVTGDWTLNLGSFNTNYFSRMLLTKMNISDISTGATITINTPMTVDDGKYLFAVVAPTTDVFTGVEPTDLLFSDLVNSSVGGRIFVGKATSPITITANATYNNGQSFYAKL